MTVASALWTRLDVPGHDACWLDRHADGWVVRGFAVFAHRDGPAGVRYRVECAPDWVTRRGEVRGSVGSTEIALSVERHDDGRWFLDGAEIAAVHGLLDLDFGFTPATNLPLLRRLSLAIGVSAEVSVAWLDIEPGDLSVLPQRYERRDEREFWYESPTVGYAAMLTLDENGFIERYPDLWIAEG